MGFFFVYWPSMLVLFCFVLFIFFVNTVWSMTNIIIIIIIIIINNYVSQKKKGYFVLLLLFVSDIYIKPIFYFQINNNNNTVFKMNINMSKIIKLSNQFLFFFGRSRRSRRRRFFQLKNKTIQLHISYFIS